LRGAQKSDVAGITVEINTDKLQKHQRCSHASSSSDMCSVDQ